MQNMYSEKISKNSIKPRRSSFPDLLYSKATGHLALKGNSKDTWALEGHTRHSGLKVLGHSGTQGTRALEHSRHPLAHNII